MASTSKYWLMKAEPDSRVVKGKDVKFSVDDFEEMKTTAWEGVRNHQAKNFMKEMQLGDNVLFYHSNCKTPGIAAFATVSKLAYPDHTAWDSKHPYYDPRSDEDKPTWYMVDLSFGSRVSHFLSLALLKRIATDDGVPADVSYLGVDGAQAIRDMPLVGKTRLSVQPVSSEAFAAVQLLAARGGWVVDEPKGKAARGRKGAAAAKTVPDDGAQDAAATQEGDDVEEAKAKKEPRGRKRKAAQDATPHDPPTSPLRRSTRRKP